jgi:ABC-type Zn uptake system ZnuABC Zn-binding protein ZnuA
MMSLLYDRIGKGYQDYRKPNARIASQIWGELVGAQSILNVGAGVGSYEPKDRAIVAVEPSWVMIS